MTWPAPEYCCGPYEYLKWCGAEEIEKNKQAFFRNKLSENNKALLVEANLRSNSGMLNKLMLKNRIFL